MLRKYLFSVLLVLIISIFYTRCTTNKFDVDVSTIDISLETFRLDNDIFTSHEVDNITWKNDLIEKYGDFYRVFVERIIKVGHSDSLQTIDGVREFITDPFILSIEDKIREKFTVETIEGFNRQLELGFKHYNYYFPTKTIPKVVYYNSGFNYGIVTMENHIGVGLDFYLGKEDSLVKIMSGEVFHQYEKDKMDNAYLVRDVIDGWLRKDLEKLEDKTNLLSVIIGEGKIMYLMEALLPHVEEEILIRYSSHELAWTKKNKKNIWRELAKQKIIYGTKNFDNQKWVTEGPFTNVGAFPEDSPARLGVWLGWQMVKSYMDDHPEITIDQLLEDKNYQLILNSYKP